MIGASEMMNAISVTARQARANPHENQRRNGDDGHGLQQDGVGIEHPPHPSRLSEHQCDDHTDDDAGQRPPPASDIVIDRAAISEGKRFPTDRATAHGDGSI